MSNLTNNTTALQELLAKATALPDAGSATSYDDTFANNDWSVIAEACQNNQVPETWKIGDQKTMSINGTDFLIDIIGKNHDTYSTGGTAPLTFQLHDCYDGVYDALLVGTTGGMYRKRWEISALRLRDLPSIMTLMPQEVQFAIRPVVKQTLEVSNTDNIVSTIELLFLLSEVEIFGVATFGDGRAADGNDAYASREGSQYAYYAQGGSTLKCVNGEASAWWERSPVLGSSVYTQCCVASDGTPYMGMESGGLSFAFCF